MSFLSKIRAAVSLRKQRGFTLLEVLMAVSIGSLVLSSGASFMLDRVNDIKDQTTAQYQVRVATAAERYIRDNLATIAGGLAINGGPTAISVPTIRAAGYLSSGVVDINPYRQTPCVLVRRLNNNATGQPRLEALVVTEGGTAIPEKRIPFIAAMGGAVGGYVPPTAPTTAQGAYGIWSQTLTTFNTTRCSGSFVSANRLAFALYFDGTTSAGGVNPDDVLYRVTVAGRPDLNRMNVALDMGGYNINSAGTITATGSVNAGGNVAAGGSVYGREVYAYGPGGYSQTYLEQWGLLGGGTIYIEPAPGTRLYLTDQWSRSGVLDVQFAGLSNTGWIDNTSGRVQISRTGTGPCCGDSGTLGLGENTQGTGRESGINFHNGGYDEGNFVLANRIARGGSRRFLAYDNQGLRMGIEATGDLTTYSGNVVTNNEAHANIFYDRYNTGYYLQPRSTSRLNYTVTDNDYTYGWKQADIYYDRYNNGYYVQPRSWSRLAGLNVDTLYLGARGRYVENMLPYHVHIGSFRRSDWGSVPAPSCPNGGAAKIQLTPLQYALPEEGYYVTFVTGSARLIASEQNVYALWQGWGWYVRVFTRQAWWDGVSYYWNTGTPLMSSSEYPGLAIAHIYCYYP